VPLSMGRRVLALAILAIGVLAAWYALGRARTERPSHSPSSVQPVASRTNGAPGTLDSGEAALARVPVERPQTPADGAGPHTGSPVAQSVTATDERRIRLQLLERDVERFRQNDPTSKRWAQAQLVVTSAIAIIMDAAGTSEKSGPPLAPRNDKERFFQLNGRAYRFLVGEFAEFDALLEYMPKYSAYESLRLRDPSTPEPELDPAIVDLMLSRAETAAGLLK